jgi:hypothetical protein
MYRSWAYILMIGATLIGMVALLWPSPVVRTIEDTAATVDAAPSRADGAGKSGKAPKAASAAKPPAKPVAPPPAVVGKMPAANTTIRRAAPVLQNGLQPNMFGQPAGERPTPPPAPAVRPGAPVSARPVIPPRPAPPAANPLPQ